MFKTATCQTCWWPWFSQSCRKHPSTDDTKSWESWKLNLYTFQPISLPQASHSQILVVLCMCESLRFTQSNLQHWQFGFNTCALGKDGAGVSKTFPRDAMPCDALTLTHMSIYRLTVWWQKVCGYSHFPCKLEAVAAACKAAITYKRRWVSSKSSKQSLRL